jgi:hypothetical protein
MRSSAQRIAAYDARMQSTQIDPVLSAVNAIASANFASYIGEFYPFQVSLRNWMDTDGVHGTAAFQYEAFNGECYSAWRRFQGPALEAQLTVLVDKYEDLGLARAKLIDISLAVWGVTVV